MSDYVKFVVRDLDPKLLRLIRKEAKRERTPVAEVMRQTLCAHYELDCIPTRYAPRQELGSRTKVLRMQPALWQAVKDDAEESGLSMQSVVHEALNAHYMEVGSGI